MGEGRITKFDGYFWLYHVMELTIIIIDSSLIVAESYQQSALLRDNNEATCTNSILIVSKAWRQFFVCMFTTRPYRCRLFD